MPGSEQTQMGWHVASDGLRDVLLELNQTYAPPEIVVTENGAAYPDTVDQEARCATWTGWTTSPPRRGGR